MANSFSLLLKLGNLQLEVPAPLNYLITSGIELLIVL